MVPAMLPPAELGFRAWRGPWTPPTAPTLMKLRQLASQMRQRGWDVSDDDENDTDSDGDEAAGNDTGPGTGAGGASGGTSVEALLRDMDDSAHSGSGAAPSSASSKALALGVVAVGATGAAVGAVAFATANAALGGQLEVVVGSLRSAWQLYQQICTAVPAYTAAAASVKEAARRLHALQQFARENPPKSGALGVYRFVWSCGGPSPRRCCEQMRCGGNCQATWTVSSAASTPPATASDVPWSSAAEREARSCVGCWPPPSVCTRSKSSTRSSRTTFDGRATRTSCPSCKTCVGVGGCRALAARASPASPVC